MAKYVDQRVAVERALTSLSAYHEDAMVKWVSASELGNDPQPAPDSGERWWAFCRKHWPMVPRSTKRRIRMLQRAIDREDNLVRLQTLAAAYWRLLDRTVERVTERAMGI